MDEQPAQRDRRKKRGFAAMNAQRQREIARLGGKAAHQRRRAHEFTPEEARQAGRKGGQAVSRDRAHMSAIGRRGGQARGKRSRPAAGEVPQPPATETPPPSGQPEQPQSSVATGSPMAPATT